MKDVIIGTFNDFKLFDSTPACPQNTDAYVLIL